MTCDPAIREQCRFELCYLPDMPATLRALAGSNNSIENGGVGWRRQKKAGRHLYHPERAGDVSKLRSDPLPVTFATCEVIEERWAIWKRHDPIVAVKALGGNLQKLKALYIDCGENDQFNLLYGARRSVRRLDQMGIAHRYAEFADNHSGVFTE